MSSLPLMLLATGCMDYHLGDNGVHEEPDFDSLPSEDTGVADDDNVSVLERAPLEQIGKEDDTGEEFTPPSVEQLVEACLFPDTSLCPVDLETGERDQLCVQEVEAGMEALRSEHENLVDPQGPVTVMAYRWDPEGLSQQYDVYISAGDNRDVYQEVLDNTFPSMVFDLNPVRALVCRSTNIEQTQGEGDFFVFDSCTRDIDQQQDGRSSCHSGVGNSLWVRHYNAEGMADDYSYVVSNHDHGYEYENGYGYSIEDSLDFLYEQHDNIRHAVNPLFARTDDDTSLLVEGGVFYFPGEE